VAGAPSFLDIGPFSVKLEGIAERSVLRPVGDKMLHHGAQHVDEVGERAGKRSLFPSSGMTSYAEAILCTSEMSQADPVIRLDGWS